MLRLIIKGTVEEAKAAGAARNITVRIVPPDGKIEGYVTGETNVEEERVVRWFCEKGTPPFPTGTLMHYTLTRGKGVYED